MFSYSKSFIAEPRVRDNGLVFLFYIYIFFVFFNSYIIISYDKFNYSWGILLLLLLLLLLLHKRSGTPVESHFRACNSSLTMDDVKIIAISNKCTFKLMTLEALFIKDINTIRLLIQKMN